MRQFTRTVVGMTSDFVGFPQMDSPGGTGPTPSPAERLSEPTPRHQPPAIVGLDMTSHNEQRRGEGRL